MSITTVDQLVETLRADGARFKIATYNMIRALNRKDAEGLRACPLVAAMNEPCLNEDAGLEAIRRWGMADDVAVTIMAASDNVPNHDTEVRAKLLSLVETDVVRKGEQ